MKASSVLTPDSETEALARLCKSLLIHLGEDPSRTGLLDTPQRFAKALKFLTSGYTKTATDVIGGAIFPEDSNGLVIVRDIEFYSLCEHHLLPFFGVAHVAYLPNDRVVGLSKIARIVELFARRLQVQERLTQQITESLQETLKPRGVFVTLEASHLCMMMRGVQKQQSKTITQNCTGVFEADFAKREEALAALRRNTPYGF